MRSLFLRIFFSFWLALAMFLVLAILATAAMRPTRRISALEALQPKFLTEAVDAYQSGGPEKLHDYLRSVHDSQHVRMVLYKDDRSVAGHFVAPWFDEVARGRRHTADTLLGRLSPHFQMLKASMTGADGHRYVLVTELPPGETAMFGPNGIPVLGIFIGILTSGIVCYFLARYLTAPIIRLRQATQKLAAGDLSARVGGRISSSGDEISQLVRDFDKMAEQIESLVNAQSRLLKDISHELRSPLARLTVALELARQRTGPDAQSILDRISLESSRMNELIGNLMTISRLEGGPGNTRKVPVDVEQIVDEVARDAAFEAQGKNCQVEVEILDELPVVGDPALLRSAIENIVRNATRYTPDGTTVKIRAQAEERRGMQEAVIRVSDAGPGVPEDSLDKIFRPFYRIDDARVRSTGGVGLGLSITEQAVRLHGGSVRASNLPEGGLSVEIRLPMQASGSATTAGRQAVAAVDDRT
jgi:signal transduction histidine kinase